MLSFPRISDLAAHAGQELGTSSWWDVTQDRLNRFADATDDHQWIHLDAERTQREFGTPPVAHGFLTLSLLPVFSYEIFEVRSAKRIINYGLNKVRFPAAVHVGDRLRGHFTLLQADLTGERLRIICAVTVERQGHEKPALLAETVTVFFE